jgi:hypothetical protein
LDSGGSLSDDGSIDNGDQGSANNRWRVDDNWCRIRNWRQNSDPLTFGHRGSLNDLGNWCRWSLDWSQSWNWSLSESWKHDFQHLSDPETDDLCSRCIEVDVTSWLENVRPNMSLGIQQ